MESKLKAVRAGNKSAVTRLLRRSEEEQLDEEDRAELLVLLVEKQTILRDLNQKILDATTEEHIEDEITQTDEYTYFLNTKIRHLRKKYSNPTLVTTPVIEIENRSSENESSTHPNENFNQHSSVPHISQTQVYHVPQSSNLNLPKLTLPTYNGDVMSWQTFWDSFESSVHFNVSLSDVQKFTYLKSYLTNEAASSLEGLQVTNSNYMEAVQILKERFGQPHKITNAYMQALLEIRAPQYNLPSLRAYYDKIEAYIRGLQSLGRSGDSYGALLIPVILNKLPSEVKQHLTRENGSDNWELNNLRSGILKEITILEAGQLTHSSIDRYQYPPVTASFLINANSNDQKNSRTKVRLLGIKDKPCVYCSNVHDPVRCQNVLDYYTRLSIVKQKKLCFNCLGSHRFINCKSKFRCRQCKGKHHTSLCKQHIHPSVKERESMDGEKLRATTVSLNSSTVQSHSNVLLKTAVAPVCGKSQCLNSNILFDEGAQRSFVTDELAKKLNIEILDTEAIQLSAFGNTENKVSNLRKGRLYVKPLHGKNIPLNVLIVPTIASPLINTVDKRIEEIEHIRGLRLAHPITTDNVFDISILIGADFYWDFIEDEIVRGNGPTAVKSKVGYLLSGKLSNPPQSYG